jgi:thiol:disulfide interchange protein DsbA
MNVRRSVRLPRYLLSVLAVLLSLPLAAGATGPSLVAGVDYVEIPDGQPFSPRDGRIEVAEIFGYICPHCAHFEPKLAAWKAGLGDDVKVVPVPAPFGGPWVPYAKAYLAAKELGLADRTHAAMFDALHVEQSLPISRPQPQEIAGFYARHGADPQRFVETMNSAAVDAQIGHARDFIERSFGDDPMGTPALVVAGKYRVTGNSVQDVLDTARALVERERAARQP